MKSSSIWNESRLLEFDNLGSHLISELDYEIKWLKMISRPVKEFGNCDDIVFLSEIITNSMYWQPVIRTLSIIKEIIKIANA